MTHRPNFLFILTDQQRFDSLGCAGNRIAHTPNLDKLAKAGTRFSHCYASQAVCSPSRASIISGLFPTSHLVRDNIYHVDDTTSSPDYNLHTTWPGLLQKAGYRTCWIGKWHLGEQKPGCFDEWYGFNSLLPHWMGEPQKSKYRVEVEADQAIEFLKRNKDRPFALCLSHYPPHTPRTAPVRFASLYPNMPMLFQMYYGAISAIEWHVGRVLAALKELGLRDNTVVIFTSDHGEHFGMRPGGANKRSAYDESARVPLIFSLPSLVRTGTVRHELVSNVDLMPTILELAGVEVPNGLHGMSLVPLLQGKSPSWRSSVLIQNTESVGNQEPGTVDSRAVCTHDWKLILRDSLSDHARSLYELYDLCNDPFEFMSVYRKDNAEIIRNLLVEMDYWAEQIGDRKTLELTAACAKDLSL
ncbi:MAG: sulfatase family protein [Armatimonadota bacterium]